MEGSERVRPGGARPARRERGAAAVELALVLPILLLLVFGIIAYGYMLSFRQGISQAAAEGARAAAVAQSDADRLTQARSAVNAALAPNSVSCSGSSLVRSGSTVGTCTIAVATCTGEASTIRCVTVTLDYDYKNYPLLSVPGVGVAMPDRLKYSAVARVS